MGARVGPQWAGIVTSSIETSAHQLDHNQSKLAYEMDSWDLYEAVGWGEPITIIDGRSAQAYARAHIPGQPACPTGGSASIRRNPSTDRGTSFVRSVGVGKGTCPCRTVPNRAMP